ncbi:transmembrane protein 186 [Arctopsyche grandis]|uniref:transmembrane protein 186 n=1 Tax=Arctopsyche grandis TaxID=121162 RepID=UPI00406D6DA2
MLTRVVLNHARSRFNIRYGIRCDIQNSLPSNRATMCTVQLANNPDEKFKMIYRLEEMHLVSLASRAKVFQATCTVLVTPLVAAGEFVNLVPENTTIVAAILGFMTTSAFTMFSFLSKGTIGIIKYNEEENVLKVSSLNFWGARNDEIVPVDDWVPLSELRMGFTSKFYHTTQRYSTSDTMKLFCKNKYVLDEKVFESVIGVS